MISKQGRREFIRTGAFFGLASQLQGAQALFGESETKVRIGFVGVGNRGSSLARFVLDIPGVEIPAICDINILNLEGSLHEVERRTGRRPEGYSRGEEDFRRMVVREDLDAVITATPWEWHTPVMVAAMNAGKYAATEVPAASTVDECWDLVLTSETTGMPCMMLENVCYFREVMAVLNMVRQDVLGELLHCETGYQHDVRFVKFNDAGELLWRGNHSAQRNGNLYPTHPIGPVAHWMNINRGDRFSYLVSMSTKSRGLNNYAKNRFGADHPNATRPYALGDINTTLIKTHQGLTVTLYHDTGTPRPYDLIFRIQGTGGIYSGTLGQVYIEDESFRGRLESTALFISQFEHPMWKALGPAARNYPHGGADFMQLVDFVKAVRNKTSTPIDVYDSATWSVIAPLSEMSVANGSTPIEFPDFTRGRWATDRLRFGADPHNGNGRSKL